MPVYALDNRLVFPPPQLARSDGLLAVGGDLSVERLLLAYRNGIFPWFSHGDPILWFSPDPRMVLSPAAVRVTRSLDKVLRNGGFSATFDTAFERVIAGCAEQRGPRREETWIVPTMKAAYTRLHREGYAHSVEVWHEGELAGGLYGVSLGGAFFGESMFHRRRDASKVALIALCHRLVEWDFDFIDCQMETAHLTRLGGRPIPRDLFLDRLRRSLRKSTVRGAWTRKPEPLVPQAPPSR